MFTGLLKLVSLACLFTQQTTLTPNPRAVAIEPGVCAPGRSVLLRWYFTGTKVVLSGGRFGKGAVVTGRSSITDRPTQTTRYAFDVWFPASPGAGGAAQATSHVQYTAVVPVEALSAYRDAQGWTAQYLKAWRPDRYSPDPASQIVYFQPEEDSIDRLAVAVLPIGQDDTLETLSDKVCDDIPSHYTRSKIVSRYRDSHAGEAAQLLTFEGIDAAHPNDRLTTITLTVVHNKRFYVASARTRSALFPKRQALLEGLVRSVSFGPSPR